MVKRRKNRGKRRRKIPVFATTGLVLGLYNLYTTWRSHKTNPAFVMQALTGYNMADGTWDYRNATAGIPMVLGPAASMLAAKSGINRYVNVPYFKL